MTTSRPRRPRPPLDQARLDDLALHYVGKFATSRAKLVDYLKRKLRERGWSGDAPADPDALADRLVGYGYIDDSAYSAMKERSLASRGYGERRLGQTLMAAGIAEEDRQGALDSARDHARETAMRYAKRRRIGPFAAAEADRPQREKWISAMVRAGHSPDLARRIASLPPGSDEADDMIVS